MGFGETYWLERNGRSSVWLMDKVSRQTELVLNAGSVGNEWLAVWIGSQRSKFREVQVGWVCVASKLSARLRVNKTVSHEKK